jgi:excisionase family DNA binding protein
MAPSTGTARPRLTRDDVLDAREVADLLHLPISTALDLARRGVLPGHKLGRRWIFLQDEIEAHVRTAPGRIATAQPPGHDGLPPATRRAKRYPKAVPATPSRPQQALFT